MRPCSSLPFQFSLFSLFRGIRDVGQWIEFLLFPITGVSPFLPSLDSWSVLCALLQEAADISSKGPGSEYLRRGSHIQSVAYSSASPTSPFSSSPFPFKGVKTLRNLRDIQRLYRPHRFLTLTLI